MALDKLVDSSQLDADLTSVANAIRTKGGTSGQLAFPSGFVSAVQAIPSGGGSTPTGTKQISITANGTTTEDVAAYANAEITVNVPSGYTDTQWLAKTVNGPVYYTGTSIPTLDGFQKVTEFSAPNLVNAFNMNYGFRNCYLLEKISLPKVTRLQGADNFKNCRKLPMLVLPSLGKGTTGSYAEQAKLSGFNGCSILQVIDVYALHDILSKAFQNCPVFDTLIIRNRSGDSGHPIASLAAIDAFSGTPFASGGAGGTLYVPSADISAYQAATNWSTILGYSTNSIQAIEGSAYENAYVDGTPIT